MQTNKFNIGEQVIFFQNKIKTGIVIGIYNPKNFSQDTICVDQIEYSLKEDGKEEYYGISEEYLYRSKEDLLEHLKILTEQ